MRRVLLSLLSLVFLASPTLGARDWASLAESVYEDHFVGIYEDGPEPGYCSGVVVAKDWVLTAGHCTNKGAETYDAVDQFMDYHAAEFLARGDEDQLDLGLLEVIVPNKRPIPFAKESPENGSDVMALGFRPGYRHPSITRTHVMNHNLNTLFTDSVFQYGYSGGPLVNQKGELVGIDVATNFKYGIGFTVPIEQVRLFLAGVLSDQSSTR